MESVMNKARSMSLLYKWIQMFKNEYSMKTHLNVTKL